MAKILIAPDSFKGSATSAQVARALADGWNISRPHDEIVIAPFADGGEGTLDCIESVTPGSVRIPITVQGATGATGATGETGAGVVTGAVFCTDFGTGGVPARGAFTFGAEPDPPGAGVKSEKKSHHALSTDCGSAKYLSYISSTSHSLAPKSLAASLPTTLPTIEFTCGLESDADTGPPSVLAQNSL